MRAAVIGANWGQTHVRALRQHGVDVVALCGAPDDHERTTAVAAKLKIGCAVANPSHLLELDLNLATVASPAASHAPLIRLLAELPLICEKPLLGMTGDPRRLPDDGGRVWVNYAFSFLDSARRMAEIAGQLGGVRAARLMSGYDLPLMLSPGEMVFEVASHPLSFAVHVLGSANAWGVARGSSADSVIALAGLLGDVPTELVCAFQPGLDGLRHTVSMDTAGGRLELTGRYQQGRSWRFGRVRLNAEPVGARRAWRRTAGIGRTRAASALRCGHCEANCPATRLQASGCSLCRGPCPSNKRSDWRFKSRNYERRRMATLKTPAGRCSAQPRTKHARLIRLFVLPLCRAGESDGPTAVVDRRWAQCAAPRHLAADHAAGRDARAAGGTGAAGGSSGCGLKRERSRGCPVVRWSSWTC